MSALLALGLLLTAGSADDSVFPFDGTVGTHTEVHDPSVVDFDGTYLCFNTGNEFCSLRTSKDLRDWKPVGGAMKDAPEWLRKQIPGHRSIWAPAALRVGKKGLRLYYCASERFGTNSSVIGMVENLDFNPEKPQEGWVDRGKLIESKAGTDDFNAIDPDAFIDQKGRHWMVYGSYWSGIFLVELDPATGLRLDPSKPPKHVASNSERGNPLEAPFFCYHDGYYYLFVVYGLAAQGVRSTYRMMVGRSKSMDESFVGFDGKPMTEGGYASVLKSSPPMFAPGGGNIFLDHNGKWMLAYHFYDGRKFWHGDVWGRPTMQIREVVWGKDGWPLPGLPALAALKGHKGFEGGLWLHQADFGEVGEIELARDGKIKSEGRQGAWAVQGDTLTMTWDGGFEDKVQLAYDGRYYVGRNRAGFVIRGIRKDAAAR